MSASIQFLTVCIYLIFFTLMGIVILARIMKDIKVTTDTIYGSICGYLLLGVIWTEIFSLIEFVEPGSFLSGGEYVIQVTGDIESRVGFENLLYYSFVTLTTLGYGDIIPVSPAAKAFSALEAVTGQLFIAVLIARLVGLHTVHSGRQG
jgi:hypothetical protein